MAISIALIIISGLAADYLFRRIKLPGLVGMLLAGILCGPYLLNLMAPEMLKVSGDFRKSALKDPIYFIGKIRHDIAWIDQAECGGTS